jgi:hypothetical protein
MFGARLRWRGVEHTFPFLVGSVSQLVAHPADLGAGPGTGPPAALHVPRGAPLTAMARLRSILLGLACPPLYLGRRRRWLGASHVGTVWAIGVVVAGYGLYGIIGVPVPQWEAAFVFSIGLLFWLVGGLLAWLWGWWPLVGAMAAFLVLMLTFNLFVSVTERTPRRPPLCLPVRWDFSEQRPVGRQVQVAMRVAVER